MNKNSWTQEELNTLVNRSCMNCQAFDETGVFGAPEMCLKAQPPQRPPAKIIVFGCSAHTDIEDIPF